MRIKVMCAALVPLLTLTLAQGQVVTKKLTVLGLGNKASVTLRLPILETGLPQSGYVIKRNGPGGEKQFVLKPLSATEAKSKFGLVENDYNLYLELLKALRTASADDRPGILLNTINTLVDVNLAHALNVLYEDSGLASGQYTYAVTGDGQDLGKIVVSVGQDVPLAAPKALQLQPAPWSVNLTWQRGDDLTPLYWVQRSVDGGAFANLSKDPMLVNTGQQPRKTDKPIDPKKTYRYRVVAQDVFGRESAPSAEVIMKGSATLPLYAPLFNKVAGGQEQVTLGWPAIDNPNVKEITVLRGERPDKLSVLAKLPASATSYVDKTSTLGEHMFYALKVSDGTNTSAASQPTAARAYNEKPASAPSGLKAVADDDNITLSWARNPERDLYGYNIYRAELGLKGERPLVRLNGDTLKTPTYTDKLKQGVQSRFEYVVRAVNTSGVEGLPSAPVTAALIDKTPPDTPLLLRAQAGVGASATSVALVFAQAPTLDLKEFQVYRAAQDEEKPALVATVPASSIGYLDSSLRPGLLYSYAVVAVDQQGNKSVASNVMSARTGAARLAAVGGLSAVVRGSQVQLSWQEQAGASAYYVFRTLNGKRIQVAGPLDAATYQDELRKGARYSVQAVSDAGSLGPVSAEVEAR